VVLHEAQKATGCWGPPQALVIVTMAKPEALLPIFTRFAFILAGVVVAVQPEALLPIFFTRFAYPLLFLRNGRGRLPSIRLLPSMKIPTPSSRPTGPLFCVWSGDGCPR
jgi:hypothetical protein